MFQKTRRRLAFWYTGVTATLLLLFAIGFYFYVRQTLIERVDDTLSHVVEIVQRSLVIEPESQPESQPGSHSFEPPRASPMQVNLEASFPDYAAAVEDDHIDLEWFSPAGELLWSTFSAPTDIPLHPSSGETVYGQIAPRLDTADDPLYSPSFALRQVTQRVENDQQLLGYLRVSHPWFEVTKPSRQLIWDLGCGLLLVVGAVAAIGWLLSGLAIAPIRDAYQRLKQFTADASHELRNPIAVIQTNVQVALADPDPSLQQDQLQVIERLTRRLGRLVDDLLFLARQDMRQEAGAAKSQTVSLGKLLQEVVEEQQALATERNLSLTLQVESDAASLHLSGDADQLTRLFTNLIGNAVQYTPSGGRVVVGLQRQKLQGSPGLQVQVQDSGIGLSEAALRHIFDRFYRVDPARSPATGTGLGLAIAKAIVESHQGLIEATSQPSQGSCFTVWLPCSKSAAATPASASSASSLGVP
ncbi:MAG: HAMP domain-containing histidine kinase [Pegethrix bostrychoides GSE-TBD4-15B]|jgi:OmpR-family two-component system manganese-sensing sensor histidine kinase|uniref:histidine kinase n=1 Tax=Pegethrix bostrychoides GSE-TBD4-15B TaxID=2839662 RepID=A0A951P796_9CYAN|nr:HAMP domain-containing histidine kinase [Pegethrix bostrychoides GSE-TBD4-15B]